MEAVKDRPERGGTVLQGQHCTKNGRVGERKRNSVREEPGLGNRLALGVQEKGGLEEDI